MTASFSLAYTSSYELLICLFYSLKKYEELEQTTEKKKELDQAFVHSRQCVQYIILYFLRK